MGKWVKACLQGRNEVPPVRTRASGSFKAHFNRDETKLRFRLHVKDIKHFTEAHIHKGAVGCNGPVVAFLFGPNKFGISVRRGVVEGTLTKADLVGPLKGRRLCDLLKLIKSGKAYVNVHTRRHPDGEIRGQLRKAR